MDLDGATVLLLLVAGFLAGFVDSIAGGGGLIGIPALLFAGAGPLTALGTNKVQAIFGAAAAARTYVRSGHVKTEAVARLVPISFAAAGVGALLATRMPTQFLERAIPVALIAIALFFALAPNVDDLTRSPRLSPRLMTVTAVPILGFYDGAFGPGTGSFLMISFVALAGLGVLAATAHTKILNLASNVGAFCVFAATGAIEWRVGIMMGFAQLCGAGLGARMAVANGARLIKPLLVLTCVGMAVRLLVF